MFMGVVAQPLPELVFGGRIFLKRISEKKLQSAFFDDSIIKAEIMKEIGGWNERVHDNTLIFSEIY